MPVTSFHSLRSAPEASPPSSPPAAPPVAPGLAVPAGSVGHGTTRLFAPRPITVDRTPGVAPQRPELAGIRHEGNVRLKV